MISLVSVWRSSIVFVIWFCLASFMVSGVSTTHHNGNSIGRMENGIITLRRRAMSNKMMKSKKEMSMKMMKSKGMMMMMSKGMKKPSSSTEPTQSPQEPIRNQLYRNATSTDLTYDVLRLEGFTLEDVAFNVSRTSYQTLFEISLPYASDQDYEEIDAAFSAVHELDAIEPDAYRRVLVVDMSLVPTGCSDDTCPSLNLTIPENVQELCVGEICIPVLCPLTLQETNRVRNKLRDFSFAPSNNKLFFGENIDCTIVKPALWDEFISLYFGEDALAFYPPEILYYLDPDADGASNIVEYYGVSPMNISASMVVMEALENGKSEGRRLQPSSSTNPLIFDTDGDLLNDGFEIGFGVDPLVWTDLNLDQDKDGLTSFEEQRVGTNPFNPDSDGDGKSDKEETDTGSDPNDDRDKEPSDTSVNITLMVGDPSGSHSERYNMVVGTTTHEAPVFGEVRSAQYTFRPGEYIVSVVWVATNLETPDYDYLADIRWNNLPEDVTVSISDPQGILGQHSESTFDYAKGKTATLTIEKECDPLDEEEVDCSCYKTCEECQSPSVPKCTWVQESSSPTGSCRGLLTGRDGRNNRKMCPCQKCKDWYGEQIKDADWINELDRCPCTVDDGFFGTNLRPVRDDGVTWSDDWACSVNQFNLISAYVNCEFHQGAPGEIDAVGCIRAPKTVNGINYGQQCCYGFQNSKYVFLKAGLKSAGTPDRSTDLFGSENHNKHDVLPYNWCCIECQEKNSCNRYIGNKDNITGEPGARSDPRGCLDKV